MEKITINLLPSEVFVRQKEKLQFNLIQKISIAILLTLMFLTSLAVTFRILQKQNVSSVQAQTDNLAALVAQGRDKEATLLLLKNKLDTIVKIQADPSKSYEIYSLVANNLPSSVTVTSLSVDKANVEMSITAPSAESLEELVSVLTEGEIAENFSKIEMESLSRAKDGSLRTNLQIIKK